MIRPPRCFVTDSPGARATAAAVSRRGLLASGLAAGAALALPGCSVTGNTHAGGKGSGSGTLHPLFIQQAGYSADNVRAMTAAFEKAHPDINVVPTFVTYEALHDKIVTAAAAGTYDVVVIDCIWPSEFATKQIATDLTSRFPGSWRKETLGGALGTAEYRGKYYGVPWGMDTKFFYANKAMLAKAGVDTKSLDAWDGVLEAARKVKAKGVVKYPLAWSWTQAEALMCDYAQLVGAFGGNFTDSSGNLILNKGGAVTALEWMRKTVSDGLTNPASTTFLEGDVERTMNNGQAAMCLNWTYYLASSNDAKNSVVVGDIAIQRTPAGPGGKRPGVNGSMALSISSGSKNQDAAWTYVKWMAGEDQVDPYAAGALPIWAQSYHKPSVTRGAPETFAVAAEQLDDLIARPQVANYNGVSKAIQAELQKALLGMKSPQAALDDAVKTATPLLTS
ncbi:extracellular solute-binding protein [Streptomyces sp. NPDC059679]|uniref:extracellular solute-binding protein n=1 Tax=Streptomyces sp. NPDC059679 TaxID=3346903 RepID=UPI0036A51593